MKLNGYHEQTMIGTSGDEMVEVYGQDGYGWYAYKTDVESDPDMFKGFDLSPSKNPLFVYLQGCTAAKLRRRGFFLFTGCNE